MSEIVIGKRYTVVIPKAIRRELSLKEGQRALIRVEKGKVIIEPLPLNPYQVLERVVKEPYREEKEEAMVERWLKEHASR